MISVIDKVEQLEVSNARAMLEVIEDRPNIDAASNVLANISEHWESDDHAILNSLLIDALSSNQLKEKAVAQIGRLLVAASTKSAAYEYEQYLDSVDNAESDRLENVFHNANREL